VTDLIRQVFALPLEFEHLMRQAEEEIEAAGEVSPELMGELERCAGKRERLLTVLGHWWALADSDLAAIEAKYKPFIEAAQNEFKHLRDRRANAERLIKRLLPEGDELANDDVHISYGASQAVEITDKDSVPFEYLSEPEPEVAKIRRSLMNGVEIPGARLKTNFNLRVKPGGPKAISSAKKRAKKLPAKDKPVEIEAVPQEEQTEFFNKGDNNNEATQNH
jgi:Siphovirus Gp157